VLLLLLLLLLWPWLFVQLRQDQGRRGFSSICCCVWR
jgi:hypothetical protein